MRPEALVLLDDAKARRLVAAWPLVAQTQSWLDQATQWAAAAGVPRPVVIRVGPALIAAGVVTPDGGIDELASKYLASVAMKGLTRR